MALNGKAEVRHNGNIAARFCLLILMNEMKLTGGSLKNAFGGGTTECFI